jgi:hypothetical protein
LYRKQRINDFTVSNGRFYDNLSEDNLKECLSHMAFGLPPPISTCGMDHQMFRIINDETGMEVIVAYNLVAREALVAYHRQALLASEHAVAGQALGSK